MEFHSLKEISIDVVSFSESKFPCLTYFPFEKQ